MKTYLKLTSITCIFLWGVEGSVKNALDLKFDYDQTPAKAHSPSRGGAVIRTLSVYSDYYEGRKMSNGKRFSQKGYTVASNDYPLGTRLVITRGSKSVNVTVTDRMAKRFSGVRVDGSTVVCRVLGMSKPGLLKVEVRKL